MEDINILINKTTRMVVLSKVTLGNDGESLQENLVFSFNDEFVNGTARLELTMPDDTNSYIMLTKVGETYQLPVKSVMTQEGKISMQLVITEGTSEEDIPIFKSNVFSLKVRKSINAETISEDEYPDFIDRAETKLNSMDEALEDVNSAIDEVENLDLDVSKSGKVATVTLTKKDATTKTETLSDGTSLMFNWDGTRLGIKTDEDSEYTYVDLQGVQGPVGPKGEAFTIKKTYTSVAEMNADFNNMQLGDYVMIASTVEVEDNAKLYTRGESQWIFISDFSGAQGIRGETGLTPNIQIGTVVTGQTSSVTRTGTNENPILNFVLEKGETGATGQTGATGATGNGIASITKTSTSGLVDTYTITYTNGTTSTFEVTNGEDGEVTETQFDKLEHRVEDLETNQLMDTVTGTNISIDDAHETEIVEGILSKESTQETTTGKNLFNYIDNLQSSVSGLTSVINDDGSITTSGVLTTNYSRVIKLINLNNILEDGQSYTYSQSEQNSYLFMQLTRTNKSTGNSEYIGLNVRQSYTFTANLSNYDYYICVQTITTSTWGTDSRTITLSYQLEKNSSATDFEPFTYGASPNPNYPQEIKTVTGYRNLFDGAVFKANYIVNNQGAQGYNSNYNLYKITTLIPGKTYTVHLKSTDTQPRSNRYCFYDSNDGFISYTEISDILAGAEATKTFTVPANTSYVLFHTGKLIENLQIVEGNDVLPYVPYGTNWIYTTVSDGTNSRIATIPLNENEIVGIGNYKDELIVDSNGHCYISKKIGKKIFNGTETGYSKFRTKTDTIYWECDQNIFQNPESGSYKPIGLCDRLTAETGNNLYSNEIEGFTITTSKFRFSLNNTIASEVANLKTWIGTHNFIVYCLLRTEQLIDLNYDIDLRLFKGINNISNSDDMDMTIKYVQDINTIIGNIKNAILEIGGE